MFWKHYKTAERNSKCPTGVHNFDFESVIIMVPEMCTQKAL